MRPSMPGSPCCPLMAVCDRWDIGGLSTNWHQSTGHRHHLHLRGLSGRSRDLARGIRSGHRHWVATVEAIERCPCATGCPSCVQSPKCGNLNEPLSKGGAIRLLRGDSTGG